MEISASHKGAFFRATPILVLAFSVAVFIGVTYSQSGGQFEAAGRTCAAFSSLLITPALLFLAARTWRKTYRTELPQWRNGLALTSLVIASTAWAMYWSIMLLATLHLYILKFNGLEWLAIIAGSNLVAGLLATALKGNSKVFVICAVILTWAGIESGIYF